MITSTKTFEDKFNEVLKPSIDKYKDSKITNSMSNVALNFFIDKTKENVDFLSEIDKTASELNSH